MCHRVTLIENRTIEPLSVERLVRCTCDECASEVSRIRLHVARLIALRDRVEYLVFCEISSDLLALFCVPRRRESGCKHDGSSCAGHECKRPDLRRVLCHRLERMKQVEPTRSITG